MRDSRGAKALGGSTGEETKGEEGYGAAALVDRLLQGYPELEIPHSFLAYVAEQEALGHPIRRADSGAPLHRFLWDIRVDRATVSRLLNSESKLVSKLCYPVLLQAPLDELRSQLEKHFSVLFPLQQAVLESEVLTGFNRHDRAHLRSVSRRILALLRASERELGSDAQMEKEATIAGYLHDSGNLISRQYHGLYGVYLLTQFFTDVGQDEKSLSSFLRMLEAVLFHEVELGLRLRSLSGLHPATLSLIIADKTDISARRVSAKSNVPGAIRDAHTLVNLLTVDSGIGCQRNDFVWELHFSPRADTGDLERFPHLLKPSERFWVPQDWQQLYREYNVEYLFVFHATFMRLYLARLLYTIRAVFALYPNVEGFRLVIDDTERGISLSRNFTRADYEAKIGLVGKNLFKQNWEETYLYQALAHAPAES